MNTRICYLHILYYRYICCRFVGDCQMPQALKIFIEEKGQEIVQKELFRNFILHLGIKFVQLITLVYIIN
jgi:hypothetical protein